MTKKIIILSLCICLLLVVPQSRIKAAGLGEMTANAFSAVACFMTSIVGGECASDEPAPEPVQAAEPESPTPTSVITQVKPLPDPRVDEMQTRIQLLEQEIAAVEQAETVIKETVVYQGTSNADPSSLRTAELTAALNTVSAQLAANSLSAADTVTLNEVAVELDRIKRDHDALETRFEKQVDSILDRDDVPDDLQVTTLSVNGESDFAGGIFLSDFTPSDTSNRLYRSGNDLYWNGSLIGVSSSSFWTSSGADVYRSSGSVGIGTTTPRSALDVVGTIYADQIIANVIDTGGEVCNVEAYGAVGDNSTINDAAIAAAIADCPEGGTVYFPMGEFRISTPIVLDRPVTLRGAYSPRWSYSSDPRSSIRADFGSFSGVAMIHVRDRTISGEADDNNGGRLEYISIDGGSASTDVTGVYFEGLVRDWKLTDVDISQTTGNGFEAAVGTGSGNPRGFTIRGLSIYSADGHGFRATALNDTFIDDLLAVGNALRGIYLSSMGETKVANSRAVFNGLTGLYIDGSSNNGGVSFTDFSTDRNDRHGVRISASGTSTIIFNGLLTRRDGPNTSGGSETPYAGLAIIGSTTEKVAPVFVSGLGQTVGVDDVGAPPLSPTTGVRVTNATYVKLDGQLWGVTESWRDDGGNDHFIIEDDAILKTGTAGAQELFTNAQKWQATSSGLYFGRGKVSIGSSTDSRLLNIVAPSQAGARFRDTTNDVIFDMRAEDFQGFFGTFSNHQLRFQTNNTSRLTIDTNGFIGIGTTSPTYPLHVVRANDGEVVGFTDPDGTCTINPTTASLNCFSDKNLKEDITAVSGALERITSLRGVNYRWKTQSDNELRYGFIAQEVEDVFPELVNVDQNSGYRMVNMVGITPALVEAVKELDLRLTEVELLGNATSSGSSLGSFTQNIFNQFGILIETGLLQVKKLVADEELCIDDTCVNKAQLEALLETVEDVESNESNNSEDEEGDEEPEEVVNAPEDETATSTEETTPDTTASSTPLIQEEEAESEHETEDEEILDDELEPDETVAEDNGPVETETTGDENFPETES